MFPESLDLSFFGLNFVSIPLQRFWYRRIGDAVLLYAVFDDNMLVFFPDVTADFAFAIAEYETR